MAFRMVVLAGTILKEMPVALVVALAVPSASARLVALQTSQHLTLAAGLAGGAMAVVARDQRERPQMAALAATIMPEPARARQQQALVMSEL